MLNEGHHYVSLLLNELDRLVQAFNSNDSVHPFDIKEQLLKIRDIDEESYFNALKSIPVELLAEVVAELPSYLQLEASESFGVKKLAKITTEMDTDDAATFLKNITKTEDVLQRIEPEEQKVIRELISYDDNVAGAYMQTELFAVNESEVVGEAIDRLRTMKKNGEIQGIGQIFIQKDNGEYLCSIGVEELVLFNTHNTFKVALESGTVERNEVFSRHFEDIKDVVEKVSDYNLSVIPVLNEENTLLGRITSDDIYDLIESHATEEMFSMAGLNPEVELAENLHDTAKKRAMWLAVNLLTAIAASLVVAYFDETIKSFVALAVLMPIVASMGGNAGTQSLTVTVRQLSIGEIAMEDALYTIKKEVSLALMNGLLFALVIGTISTLWFKLPVLGVVIALSTIINLFLAGLFGAMIPLILDRLEIDPAVASSVLLTTITDIVGFLSFLGLAHLLLR